MVQALEDIIHLNAHAVRKEAKRDKRPVHLSVHALRDILFNPCECNQGLRPFPVVKTMKPRGFYLTGIPAGTADEWEHVKERWRFWIKTEGLNLQLATGYYAVVNGAVCIFQKIKRRDKDQAERV